MALSKASGWDLRVIEDFEEGELVDWIESAGRVGRKAKAWVDQEVKNQ